MPLDIQKRYDSFSQWLSKLSDGQLLDMIADAYNGRLTNKEFISRWGMEPMPFSNWKKDMVRKELARRELFFKH